MKYKTLFRVMLKLLGVWTFIGGVEQVLAHASQVVVMLTSSFGRAPNQMWYLMPGMFTTAAQLGTGLYLFFGGKWLADKAIPGNRPYCHECGYDLTNAAGNLCSECGTPFKPAEMSSAP